MDSVEKNYLNEKYRKITVRKENLTIGSDRKYDCRELDFHYIQLNEILSTFIGCLTRTIKLRISYCDAFCVNHGL